MFVRCAVVLVAVSRSVAMRVWADEKGAIVRSVQLTQISLSLLLLLSLLSL